MCETLFPSPERPAVRGTNVKAMQAMQKQRAFTLMEMMVVVAIIAIIALMAMPDLTSPTIRAQIKDSGSLIDVAKSGVVRAYQVTGLFPKNNKEAGVPEPELMVGKYVSRVDVANGAVTMTFGNSAHTSIKGTKLTMRPAYVLNQPSIPISWICGASPVPTAMLVAGQNATDMPPKYQPLECGAATIK
jgi:type IV pilus assembly protein PilA